jgi:hypothetical protein
LMKWSSYWHDSWFRVQALAGALQIATRKVEL